MQQFKRHETTKTTKMITRNILKLFSLTSSSSSSTASSSTSSTKSSTKKKTLLKQQHRVQLDSTKKLTSKLKEFILVKESTQEFGFTIIGYCPCTIGRIEIDSVAYKAGLRQGDCIIKLNSSNVTRAASESIVKMIKSSQDTIKLGIYRNSSANNSLNDNGVISIGCHINQGDHASMGVINSTENDFMLKSITSQDNSLQNKFSLMAKNTLESFKSEDFVYCSGGDGISVNRRAIIASKTPSRTKHLTKTTNDLPSPIPFLPPIKPKSTLTDSDYKTQTSSATDLYSSVSEQLPLNKNDDYGQVDVELQQDSNDDERMDACEKLLNLEEEFIEQMQKGVQQYSRPLRHCLMINSNEHYILFQNIEKILAISEYQLNQLISQDDSTLIDMFNSIGKLYENKMRMSCEAFDIYLNGLNIAFNLLDTLLKSVNFNKFLQDSKDDIEMDLKEFLLLPLKYVEQVYECLKEIKKYTSRASCDHIALETLINSLSIYVNKSKFNVKSHQNGVEGVKQEEVVVEVDENESSMEHESLSNNNDDFEDDSDDNENAFKTRFLIYSSQLNHKISKNKYKKVNTLLFNDLLAFTSIKLNQEKLNNIQNYFNFIDTCIYLKDIVKYDFNLENNEFSLVYTKKKKQIAASANSLKYYRLKLKASSIEEKHTWTKLLIQRIKQSKFSA